MSVAFAAGEISVADYRTRRAQCPDASFRAAAFATAAFAKDDDNARACVEQLLSLDAVVVPGAPVVA